MLQFPNGFFICQVLNLTFSRTLYFGPRHNVPTGSPVLLTFANRTTMDFDWGMKKSVEEWRLLRMDVAPGTATMKELNALTVSGTRVQQKIDYTATIKTYFADEAILTRPIKGVYQVCC